MLPSTICVIRFSVLLSIDKTMAKESIFGKFFFARQVLKAANPLARRTLNYGLERVSLRDYAIMLVLGTLSDERRCLRHKP